MSKDEEELQKARLQVKRGLPLQDLSGSQGFPEERRPQSGSQEARRQQPESSMRPQSQQ